MSDVYKIPLWKFEEGGTVRGYYLMEDVSILGEFYECSPWQMIENSLWRSEERNEDDDKDEVEAIGYYLVKDVSGLGKFNDFGTLAKTDCSSYDGAQRCQRRKWRKKGCCCIWNGNVEEKIPGTCN